MKVFIIAWCLILCFFINASNQIQTAMGLITCSFAISLFIFRRIGLLCAIGYFYFSTLAIIKIIAAPYFWPGFEISDIVGLESLVAESYIYLTSIALLFCLVRAKNIKNFFIMFGLIDSFVIISKWVLGYGAYFALNNPGVEMAYIPCLIPFSIELSSPWLFIFVCLITKTSTGILGIGVSISVYFIAKKKFEKKWIFYLILAAILFGLFAYLTGLGVDRNNSSIFDSSGRFLIWKLSMEYWKANANHWIGLGAGTFQMYGPYIQTLYYTKLGITDNMVIAGFTWLHNDWLQVLFETGIIGLALVGAIFVRAVFNLRGKPAEFAALITFGVVALTQMPLRWFIPTCFVAFLIASSSEKQRRD